MLGKKKINHKKDIKSKNQYLFDENYNDSELTQFNLNIINDFKNDFKDFANSLKIYD